MWHQTNSPDLLQARHRFDALAPADVDVSAAEIDELGQLARLAYSKVPGVSMGLPGIINFALRDPESFLAFRRNGRILGGIALLYLNAAGLDALILDEICLTNPELEYLAKPDERPEAIYWWAIAARGRGVAGLGSLSLFLSSPRFCGIDFYAQPSSSQGVGLARALGFKPIPSYQIDLWHYARTDFPIRQAA